MTRTWSFAVLALLGFAANSLLTRLALRPGLIDPAMFVTLRLASGALTLAALVRLRERQGTRLRVDSVSSALLFAYAAPFSYAYLRMTAGTGALVLFGAVQITMVAWGIVRGERPRAAVWLGLAVAFTGLVALTLPGATRPQAAPLALMVGAGIAWGAYSVRGRGVRDPLRVTAGNFAGSLPFAGVLLAGALLIPAIGPFHAAPRGALLALLSGSLASGVAYSFWYAALPGLPSSIAALIQLTVPIVAALGGVVLLDERLTPRLVGAGIAVLGGVALAVRAR